MTSGPASLPVPPSQAWARMTPGVDDQMIVCADLPGQMQLCAFGGHRLGLRLGILGPGRPAALRGSWVGISTTLVAREQAPGHRYLILEGQPGYSGVFNHLADDLHAGLRGAAQAEDVPRLMLGTLQLWSGFLARGRPELDRRAAVGLYAELALLEQVVAPCTGWRAAIAMWTGPEGAPQDLRAPGLLVDVKSTTADSQLATISSIEQLDPPGGEPVWLAQALRDPQGNDTLLAIRDRVLQACAGEEGSWPVSARLRMLQAGLLGLEEDHDQMGVMAWRFHRTDLTGFPVLRRATLPDGLVRASYVIDLANCPVMEEGRERFVQVLTAAGPGMEEGE